jgi:hypothetical protein
LWGVGIALENSLEQLAQETSKRMANAEKVLVVWGNWIQEKDAQNVATAMVRVAVLA